MGTAGLSVADVQAIAHLFEVLPFVVIGGLVFLAYIFFTAPPRRVEHEQDDYDRDSTGRMV